MDPGNNRVRSISSVVAVVGWLGWIETDLHFAEIMVTFVLGSLGASPALLILGFYYSLAKV